MIKIKKPKWFLLALLGALLAAPNPAVVKLAGEVDPFLFNGIRFFLVAIVTLPALLINLGSISRKNLKYALGAGLCMSIAASTFVLGVQYSQASYFSIVTLGTPIILLIYSSRLTGERITPREISGILLAAIGAIFVIVLPLVVQNDNGLNFYPLGTLFAIINSLSFPLALIFFKKANDSKLTMWPTMNIVGWSVFAVSMVFYYLTPQSQTSFNRTAIISVLYSGIAVILLARIINVVTYEKIGSAVTGAMGYLENLIAILIPLLFLEEKLSTEVVIGALLILFGVFLVESRKINSKKAKHVLPRHYYRVYHQ